MGFDLIGHLTPSTVIPTTFDTFEAFLVQSFPLDSTRHSILEGYKEYLMKLKAILNVDFYQ